MKMIFFIIRNFNGLFMLDYNPAYAGLRLVFLLIVLARIALLCLARIENRRSLISAIGRIYLVPRRVYCLLHPMFAEASRFVMLIEKLRLFIFNFYMEVWRLLFNPTKFGNFAEHNAPITLRQTWYAKFYCLNHCLRQL